MFQGKQELSIVVIKCWELWSAPLFPTKWEVLVHMFLKYGAKMRKGNREVSISKAWLLVVGFFLSLSLDAQRTPKAWCFSHLRWRIFKVKSLPPLTKPGSEPGSPVTFCSWGCGEDSLSLTRGSPPGAWTLRKTDAGRVLWLQKGHSHKRICLSFYFLLPLTRWIRDNKSFKYLEISLWCSHFIFTIIFDLKKKRSKKMNKRLENFSSSFSAY